MLRITRKTLKRLASEAIFAAPRLGSRQIKQLEAVAETADRIRVDGWYNQKEDCGCLVGTILKHSPSYTSPLWKVGMDFDTRLRKHLGLPQGIHIYDEDKRTVQVIG